MSAEKADVVRSLRAKGLDPVRLERELVSMLRSGSGAYEVRSYLKRLLEGGGR